MVFSLQVGVDQDGYSHIMGCFLLFNMLLTWSYRLCFSRDGMFYIGAILCLCFLVSSFILSCMFRLIVSPPFACGSIPILIYIYKDSSLSKLHKFRLTRKFSSFADYHYHLKGYVEH